MTPAVGEGAQTNVTPGRARSSTRPGFGRGVVVFAAGMAASPSDAATGETPRRGRRPRAESAPSQRLRAPWGRLRLTVRRPPVDNRGDASRPQLSVHAVTSPIAPTQTS